MTSKRSKFEEVCADVLEPAGFVYEPLQLTYYMPGSYTPDFVLGDILVEVKGWFRPGDTKKYKYINESLEGSQELVFLLQSPQQRIRKGRPGTMADWCARHDIRWFASPEEVVAYANTD